MALKLEQRRLMNIMEFSSKFWKWACLVVLILGISTTLGIGLREHRTIRTFERERLEFQDSILDLNEEILARDRVALEAEQQWAEAREEYLTETVLLKSELGKVRKSYQKTLAEMSDLDTSKLKTYFAEKYGQRADTVVDSARFLLTVDVGNHIRYDLTDLEFCKEESMWQDSILTEQERYISNLDTVVNVLTVEKNYYIGRAESFEQQYNLSEQARANVQAGLDKQRTLSYILGGTAAVLAVGLVTSIILGGK